MNDENFLKIFWATGNRIDSCRLDTTRGSNSFSGIGRIKNLHEFDDKVLFLKIINNGINLASVSEKFAIKVWDLRTEEVIVSFNGDRIIDKCDISSTGSRIATLISVPDQEEKEAHFLQIEGID